jgi:hypothetical protein
LSEFILLFNLILSDFNFLDAFEQDKKEAKIINIAMFFIVWSNVLQRLGIRLVA